MADLFFYGTLCYNPLLELVLGRSSDAFDAVEAKLPDHAVHAVKDQPFPMILSSQGAEATGVLVRNLSERDLSRLAFYEAGFDYDLQDMQVNTVDGDQVRAQVFFPKPNKWKHDHLWSLERWIEGWGPVTLLAAAEVMSHFGKVSHDTIARSFPAIRTRAWARLAARNRISGDRRDVASDVVVHSRSHPYINYFGMDEVALQHRQYDGQMGPVLQRSALMQGSAVVVLPYDPVRDVVLLVEQFRAPLFLIDDPEPWIWEPVAGMIDPGETPQETAHRETWEEARITLTGLENAGGAYSSSGSSTEYVHLFVGLGELTETVQDGGLTQEGEDIRSKILPFSEFIALVDRNVFKDLPLLALAHWLARNRQRLRT